MPVAPKAGENVVRLDESARGMHPDGRLCKMMRNPFARLHDAAARALGIMAGSHSRLIEIEKELAAQRADIRELINQNWAIISLIQKGHEINSDHMIDQLTRNVSRYRDGRYVGGAPGQVYSQNNEDGIISEIFGRIGVETKTFVEIAAGDGIENTTRLLLDLGWTGVWVEAGEAEAARIREVMGAPIADGRLVYLREMVDRDNVVDLVRRAVEFDPDYLALDIDYNTSHVWSALSELRPRLVCVEYNAHFPPSVDYEVPYDPQGTWRNTTRFGASLKALERIGRTAGYSLVGCDIFGVNAFFVRDDLCDEDRFLSPFTAETHYEPPRFNAVHMRGHRRHAQF